MTVNNNGGDGGGGGKRIPGPLPQPPLNIFDPSLITPYYGINNRQPVNPPDPENVDMTELITRLSTQFQKQTQTPVLNNIATPIAIKVPQPVATEPIKIKPAIVQPIETEPIKIKPNPVEPPVEPKPIKKGTKSQN